MTIRSPRRRRLIRAGLTLAAVSAVAVLGLVLPANAAGTSYLRLAHLSPDTPAVDVTVTAFGRPDWSVTLKGVAYGAVSGYQTVQPGTYTVAMRSAGADPASTPVITATLTATEGHAYTVAGLGTFADLALRVLPDEITLPPAGQARMRVVNAAPQAGDLTVRRDGAPVIEGARFGDASPYSLLPAGRTTLDLAPQRAAATALPVELEAGGVYTVLVLETDGVLSAQVRQDAKGSQVVPTGGVETGFGGTATGPPSPVTLPLQVGLLSLAALSSGVLAVAVVRRRRTT